MAEDWQLCLEWLQSCKVLPKVFAGKDLSDFAQCLRDGVVLCQLISTLLPNIEPKDYSIRPQMSQFMCLKNIRWFLNACRNHIKMRAADLFEPYDLLDLQDFKRVMNCLSSLSITDVAVRQGFQGFQPQDDDIYKNLEELTLSDMPDEDIYGPVSTDGEREQIYEDLCSFKPRGRASIASQVARGVDKTKTDFCVEEILETEKNYVHALQMITEKFIRHLELTILTKDLIPTIFTNIEDIYTIHQDIYGELTNATSHQDIAKVFIKAQKRLVIYAEYCAGLPRAQNKVDEVMKKSDVFKHSVADCEQQANDGKFRLRDLLVVPMQRIMKYGLLLQELRKNLARESVYSKTSQEMKDIEKAIAMMQDLAYYVNEVKRDRESLETIRMIEESIEDLSMPSGTKLDDYGHLLKDGELKVKFHDDNRELKRYIFLFDKVILMCKSKGETYSYKNALVLHDYKLEDIPGGPIKVWRHSFVLVKKENKTAITFFAKSEDMKRKWMESIELAIENFDPPSSKENGFEFMMQTFSQATTCDSCNKLLAGCFYQGYLCSKTKLKVHKHCIDRAVKQVRPGPLSPRTPSHRRQRYVTKHAYHGLPPHPQDKPTLSFNKGESIDIHTDQMHDRDWYYGSKNGNQGFFPASYVEKTRSSTLSTQSRTSVGSRFTFRDSGISGNLSFGSMSSGTGSVISAGSDYVNTPDTNLSIYPWYVGMYNKKEASAMLADAEDGVFLVRESKDNPGTHAIGIAYGEAAKHIKITKTKDVFSIADFKGFNSIPDLIKYYQTHTLHDSFPELTTTLRIPFNTRGSVKRGSVSHSNSFDNTSAHEGRRPFPRNRVGSSPSLFSTSPSPRAASRTSIPPIIGKAKVSFDYSSKETNQITLVAGNTVAIVSKAGGDRGWWKGAAVTNGQLGRIGYFPMAYVEECDEDAPGFL
ncbi:guanine nucleotide exchange factor VAV2-like isoform X2 [Watersipora subatra]|uniref:guanine nucleotide exchange factor VAV2-like isoform X2 n=1 Tax=Watersipora subatra TaxID=2589382 RepID=UPI00355C2B01